MRGTIELRATLDKTITDWEAWEASELSTAILASIKRKEFQRRIALQAEKLAAFKLENRHWNILAKYEDTSLIRSIDGVKALYQILKAIDSFYDAGLSDKEVGETVLETFVKFLDGKDL